MTYEYNREVPEVKTLSYITPIRKFPLLNAAEADDFLYCNHSLISESSRSNVFIIKNHKVITPEKNILPGITRKHVLDLSLQNFEAEVRDVTLAETLEADEVFITSSNQRIIPVTHIDERLYNNGMTGEITKKIQSLFLRNEYS